MPYLKLLRLHHWVKNLFVLLPVPFALASGVPLDPTSLWLGLFAFSLLNSGVYAFNDVVDRQHDLHHPVKKLRPVASGEITPRSALIVAVLLTGVALLLLGSGAVFSGAASIGLVYLALNIFYSWWGRSIPVLDVLFLASFFFLRILLGCVLVAAEPSVLLLVGGTSIALLLALGKRRSEIQLQIGEQHRSSLDWYRTARMLWIIRIQAAISAGLYTHYCFGSEMFLEGRWWWSLPPVYVGLVLYQHRILVLDDPRSPVEMLLKSTSIQLLILVWAVTVVFGVGLIHQD
ncbi:MAG: UbiA prenyltransferase family protein [Planctomycetota bacterium]|nr:UbiA prenyltransferase family protein [Planctomycetota bacterium]